MSGILDCVKFPIILKFLLWILTPRNPLPSSYSFSKQTNPILDSSLLVSYFAVSPYVIWPSAATRSNWYTFSTPGWRFACSKTGYANAEISLHWIQHVFDPLTKGKLSVNPAS